MATHIFMIKAQNLSLGHQFGNLYENVNFSVGTNIKAGLVGPNGSGKSTLLKAIIGQLAPLEGRLIVSGTIGYVPQEVKTDSELEASKTVKDYVDPKNIHPDHQLLTTLAGLELTELSLSASPQNLSGGQKTKLSLAKALISKPDILLLDEPTNFLDQKGKGWVMNFLSNYPKTLLMISHDLELLDKYIDKIISINPQYKTIEEYKGNYSKYLIAKKQKDELLRRSVLNEQKHIKKLEKSLSLYDQFSRKKSVLARRIERLKETLPELPKEVQKIKLNLPPLSNVGEIPISIKNITKSYGNNKILENFSLSVIRGKRIALIGPNGAGKSTIIKILTGLTPPDSGEVVKDDNLKIGYYSQEFETFDFSQTLAEAAIEISGGSELLIRPFLAKFMFTGDKIHQKISTLSGGEKTRLSIALIMLKNNNFLVLDEPTTYLDVTSQKIILEAVKSYTGAMLIVSHTEEFITELNPDTAVIMPDGLVRHWSPELVAKVSEI